MLFTVYTLCSACNNTVYQEHHSLRKESSAILKQTLTWNPQRKYRRVKPRRSWRKMIDEEAAIVRKMWTVKAIARKRFHWLCFVEALYPKVEYCNWI